MFAKILQCKFTVEIQNNLDSTQCLISHNATDLLYILEKLVLFQNLPET